MEQTQGGLPQNEKEPSNQLYKKRPKGLGKETQVARHNDSQNG